MAEKNGESHPRFVGVIASFCVVFFVFFLGGGSFGVLAFCLVGGGRLRVAYCGEPGHFEVAKPGSRLLLMTLRPFGRQENCFSGPVGLSACCLARAEGSLSTCFSANSRARCLLGHEGGCDATCGGTLPRNLLIAD